MKGFLFYKTLLADTSDCFTPRTGLLFFVLESATVVFFTFDIVIRCFAHPNRTEFLKGPATWLDVMTIAPFFVELFIDFSKLVGSLNFFRFSKII